MQKRARWLAMVTGLAILGGTCSPLVAQSQTALSGRISSAEEGPMEGVLISARKIGSTVTINVVSDRDRAFQLPRGQAGAGPVFVEIRAVGYDLDSPRPSRCGCRDRQASPI